jgi:hypothetical protein
VANSVVYRGEIVDLLFNVSDIVAALSRIEKPIGEDAGEEEADEG